jgi:N-acetylmuramoyl-L-alanine amidase
MRKIFISAGHSNKPGRDRGASGNGFIEGNLAAELRSLIVVELQEQGINPIVDNDDSILSETINLFKNKTSPNSIVVDIHFNAGPPTATGTETLIPSDNTLFERQLAEKISDIIHKRLGIRKRGNYNGHLGVKTEAESHHGRLGWMRLTGENILLEVCFITNKNDIESYNRNKIELAKDIANVLIEAASDGKTNAIEDPNYTPSTHTVVSGDTLSKIAVKYKITVSNLMKLNGLRSDIIKIGQSLLLR